MMVPLDKHSVSSRNHKTSKMGMTWSPLKRLACAPTTSHFPLIVLMIYPFWISLNHFLKSVCVCSVAQSFQHFCDPTDCSLPGSSLHGIILARILEQVAISYSRGIFPTQGSNSNLLCLLHWQVELLQLSHLGISDEGPGLCVDIFEVT